MQILDQLKAKGVTPAGLTVDSRHVKPGDVFLAYPGAHVDGRNYIAHAVANGAAGVIAEAGQEVGGQPEPLLHTST